uniref:Major facilitator superfamily (MFS) profile domain-containing protein n=1 Tax=Strigamia maritima TaxID=126957 RepID=T1J272_STRMM
MCIIGASLYAVNWTAVVTTSDQWPSLSNASWPTESSQLIACVCVMLVPEKQVWVIVSLSMIGKFGVAGSSSIIYIFAGELYPTPCATLSRDAQPRCAYVVVKP